MGMYGCTRRYNILRSMFVLRSTPRPKPTVHPNDQKKRRSTTRQTTRDEKTRFFCFFFFKYNANFTKISLTNRDILRSLGTTL